MTISWNLLLRLVAGALIGGLIGAERELRAKEAGIRTHVLVALGSTLFMVISQFAFEGSTHFDASRVAAQVVSGIGFIGAGTIIFQKNVIRGLTTAAGMWVTAAIGLACGAGMFVEAGAAALLSILCLEFVHFINLRYGHRRLSLSFTTTSKERVHKVLETLKDEKMNISDYSMTNLPGPDAGYRTDIVITVRNGQYITKVLDILGSIDGVTIETLE